MLSSSAPDGSDWRVLVRERAGEELVADQEENFLFPGPEATRAACSAGIVVPAPAQHPGLVADCEVLAALRAVLFGWAGTNWTTNTPLGEWEGVVVGGAPPRVRELAFLERLELSDNRLTGSIPAAWGPLARLRWLDLRENKLAGGVPAELGQLGNLQQLWLADNQLTGAIPVELGNLAQLQDLAIGNNSLSGTIPSALGQLRNLEVLGLGDNDLSGTIRQRWANSGISRDCGSTTIN